MVCSSWSRARRAPLHSRMPHRIRSPEHVFGIPNLPFKDHIKVQTGNHMYRNTLQLVKKAIDLNIPGFVENPA
eukprot:8473443-Karenia_brevis.AAC.1